ncbi:hypothetical protein SCA04_05540 [Staphylococcus carnosus]|nr:hypothetical protein SCA04_05540 [Staphylococcus carnosus]
MIAKTTAINTVTKMSESLSPFDTSNNSSYKIKKHTNLSSKLREIGIGTNRHSPYYIAGRHPTLSYASLS